MDDKSPNPPDADEVRDRLIDRGLRELLGGETPSDLSERILAAAGGQGAIVTQTLGGEAMDGQKMVGGRSKSRWGWAQFAVAATLLIGASAAFLVSQVKDIESARRTAAKASSRAPSKPSAGAEIVAVEGEQVAEFDGLVDAITSTVETEAWNKEGSGSANEPNLSIVVGQSQRLHDAKQAEGGGSGGHGQADPLLPSPQASEALSPATSSSLGLQGLVNDAYGVKSTSAEDAETQERRIYAELQSKNAGSSLGGPSPTDNQAQNGREGSRIVRFGLANSGVDDASVIGRPLHLYKSKGRGVAAERETDSLMMLVTPHIIIQEEEKERLGIVGDKYAQIVENAFKSVSAANTDNRLSTFSIDVDTASYANVRQFLMQSHTLPPPDAVRIEELVNYFDYDYTAPTGDVPFAANVEVAGCPWAPEHRLARVGIKGREMDRSQRPQSNLVFLIDVSGSMDEPNKLPLLVEGLKLLTRELGENDRVAMVVYASSDGLALESTRGDQQSKILTALDQLAAGGSTAGGAGIKLAYQVAADHFIKGGTNRVILCTDGDFNVGVTSPAELERMAETKAKETGVFLTVLGFGRGNLNDAMMEQVADKGNGNYHYVDTRKEARKVLVEEMAGTLVTIAKDVKIQVEFNPAKVAGYRLIGYENRVLAAEDFNDDKKDAGEIGAGHTVTALYELVPVGVKVDAEGVDKLKYGEVASATAGATKDAAEAKTASDADASDELLTLKIRYKAPDGDKSTKLEFPITDNGQSFAKATDDFKFASSVASFGMLLRGSQFKGNAAYAGVAEIAEAASERDPHGYRKEFVEIVGRAKELSGE